MSHQIMVKCTKCQRILPEDCFGPERRKANGKKSACRECYAELGRDRTLEGKNRPVTVRQQRQRNASSRRWARTKCGKEYMKRWWLRNLEKRHAKDTVRWAVKTGKLPTARDQICVLCGGPAEEYHHEDHAKRLEVVPVCHACHMLITKRKVMLVDVEREAAKNG